MNRKIMALMSVLMLLAALSQPLAKTSSPTRRIKFKPGATEASVKGRLNGMKDVARFVLRARKGQHMRVEIIAPDATRGFVRSPSGAEEGQPGGVIFDDELTETGDYRIRVTESPMGEAWKGSFTLKVTITG